MTASLFSTMRTALGVARRVVDLAGLLLIAGLAVMFVLQFGHPPKWDTLRLVVEIRRVGDPILHAAGPWLGLRWPAEQTEIGRFLPVIFMVLVFAARQALNGMAAAGIERCRQMEKAATKRQRVRQAQGAAARPLPPPPAPIPSPAPAPAARPAEAPPASPGSPAPAPAPGAAPAAQTEGTALTPAVALTNFLNEPLDEGRSSAPKKRGSDTHIEAMTTVAGGPPKRPSPPPAPRTSASGVPERIDRYEIVAELGRGAMGVVYRGYDAQIGRTVAIKTILGAHLDAEALESFRSRFFREAQAVGRMSHPNIVAVHDLTEDDQGRPCMVMEFVEGRTLDKIIASERIPLGEALDIVMQVAEALDYAHSRGVIHRDIKPANILVGERGVVKVMDFGIAKMEGAQLTQTGQLLGTPAFMSPEQFMGSAIDSRTDLFSLGTILYWLCTGEKPFPGETVTAIAYKVVQTAPVPARQLNPALPPDIDVILSRCLAKSPEKRYHTAHQLTSDLEAFKAGRPVAPMASDD